MILAIDQGTTGSTVLVFDPNGNIQSKAYSEFSQIYPKASWVEHDPMEIWQVTLATIKKAIAFAGLSAKDIRAIGITNQRETCLLWDRTTGKPVHNAIVWQCRRSAEICGNIKAHGKAQWIKDKTGLVVDAYFSATKVRWLFDTYPEIAQQAKVGKLAFGTIDSWLIWQLSGGKAHVTDHTNASRTMLYNIHQQSWDQELLAFFDIPQAILPSIQDSASHFASTDPALFEGAEIAITGVAGDQQAALFGQGNTSEGQMKNTYGTGCFMLMHTGDKAVSSDNGLLTTMACDENGAPAYALEGSVFMAGAAVQWLRDELQIIDNAQQTQAIAESIEDTAGVYVVPAFTGLGAPHWDMQARGAILGLTRGAGRKHIVRATLESIAYQVNDVLTLMAQESNVRPLTLKVDGGACANDFLMQFQADILGVEVLRPTNIESTAIGAALLAGIGCNLWQAQHLPQQFRQVDKTFAPNMNNDVKEQKLQGWQQAVNQVKHH